MYKLRSLLALACLLAIACALTEISMEHRKRSPREVKMFLNYMNRGDYAEKINQILAKIFPSELTPNIYAYPEVKILNYLDAQYYGYSLFYIDKSISVLLLNNLELYLIPDHLTFGSHLKSADFHLHAIFTNISTHQRALVMSIMEAVSTLLMVQAQFQDL